MSARFCAGCGAPLVAEEAGGAPGTRRACSLCARVHFDNPAILSGVILQARSGGVLCLTPLGHGEKLQSAALRALGNPPIPETRLALYCALTDLDEGAVCLVFRLLASPADATGLLAAGATAPCGAAWVAELLRRHDGDRSRGCFPVYAARCRAGVVSLEVVPCEE